MTPASTTSYDELPYESNPFAFTHPDRLATIALLFGLKAPGIDRCRVLELGCASGGNLIPMAVSLPESRFIGVDLSRRQIADGQAVINALRLRNIELKSQSILDVDTGLGEFDYIICHGVYSWVSAETQDKLLTICAEQLTPNGVACVSYNTYPGWYGRHMIRDILCYQARQFSDLRDRVPQARTLLNFLAQTVTGQENEVYRSILVGAAEAFGQRADFYLLHEYLEEANEPLFFHQFVDRAAVKGLQYVADAKFVTVLPGTLPPGVEETLRQLAPDRLRREQYLDFLHNQTFRRSLLCHREITLSSVPRLDVSAALYVASAAQPLPGQPDRFRAPDGRGLTVSDPLLRAVLLHLYEIWPEATPGEELRAVLSTHLGPREGPQDSGQETTDWQSLETLLLNAYLADLVELHVLPPTCVRWVSARPVTTSLARYQAETGARVTNLRHETSVLSPLERHLVRHLDGSRDRASLIDVLVNLVTEGVLGVSKDGVRLTQPEQVRTLLDRSLDEQLAQLARRSLLVA
jgi:SAM-dependent methyltransferase